MDIMNGLLSSFFSPEFEGKNLMRQGELSRDQFLQFFAAGKELFADRGFTAGLAMAFQRGASVQDLVDKGQARLFEERVQPAVQGDYGIACLGTARVRFGNDAAFQRQFYEFVHLEEKTLDEAELPPDVFKSKYANIDAMRSAMEAKMKEHQAELQGLSPEDQQKFMAKVFQTMVESSLGSSRSACGSAGCGSCPLPGGGLGVQAPSRPTLAPAPVEAPSSCANGPAMSFGAPSGAPQMSEAEQLAFFEKMQRSR